MKADDDIFMRVPLYLKYLELLPREKLNMGRAVGYPKEFSDEITWHTIGYASTLSRDVVMAIVDYEPLKHSVKSPLKFRHFESYMDFRALNEDIMIGEVIRTKLKLDGLLTVDMQDCHYVMNVKRPLDKFVEENPNLIVFHHVKIDEYIQLRSQLKEKNKDSTVLFKLERLDSTWSEFSCHKLQ
uniref:Hexosyltransferase n=1 Tax=Trypanosoma brucei brucei (strain 927/4 GUTat10.1) TaxID=185431 RepID=Q4FKE7_TRYB2|nr:hypothetical protein Tb11.0740 [Trypanosoma brucei brucei TREU927]